MKLKNKFYWIVVVTVVGLLSSLWFLVQSKADDPDSKSGNQIFLPLINGDGNATNATAITPKQITTQAVGDGGRIDGFTYYIPFPADFLDDQLERGASDPPPARVVANFIGRPVVTSISIAVQRAGTIIYYDQWEDGYEGDLTFPTQSSTQIWGDNDPSNGAPPGIASDVLNAGAVILLQSQISLPRNPSNPFFDGGDTLSAVGGPISVSMMFWPQDPPGIRFADAWELYPTSRWGTTYQIPIGENVTRVSNAQSPPQPPGNSFDIVGLYVQAVQDGTTVSIDLNNDGTPDKSGTINQGQTFDVVANNLIGAEGAPTADSVLAGATVQASAPVQVTLFINNPVGRWEARGYTMVPTDQWVGDYMYPRSSDGDYWLFNPGATPLTVNVALAAGATDTLTIPANSTAKYPPAGLITTPTGIRFTAGAPFYGLAAFDSGDTQDWGSALIPFENLTTQILVGLGPGSDPITAPTASESPVYVTASNNTTIHVIFSDGSTIDVPVAALAEVPITASNFNMSGAQFFTDDGTPFIAVWGQRDLAPGGTPSIDAGTSIAPLRALMVQKTFDLQIDNDCNGIVSLGDRLRFELQYLSNAATSINGVNVQDNLPSALGYVLGSTTSNGSPISDGGTFPLAGSGFNAGNLNPRAVGSLTYDTIVNNASGNITNIVNVGAQRITGGTDDAEIQIPTGSASPVMTITTALVDPTNGIVIPGQTITVNLTITNTSSSSNVIELPVQYNFNDSQLSFVGASITPDNTSTGVLSWNDLAPAGNLAPGQVVNILLNFTVDQIPAGNSTNLTALINDARRENSAALLRCRADATASLSAPPTPTPTPPPPTPSPTPRPPHNGNPQSTPQPTLPPSSNPPTPTPAAVAAVVPAVTPTGQLPVLFLPETGTKEAEQGRNTANVLLIVVLTTTTVASLWFWQKTKRAKLSTPPGKNR